MQTVDTQASNVMVAPKHSIANSSKAPLQQNSAVGRQERNRYPVRFSSIDAYLVEMKGAVMAKIGIKSTRNPRLEDQWILDAGIDRGFEELNSWRTRSSVEKIGH